MDLFPHPDETIEGASAAIRSGRLRCVDLLDRCLARIDAREAEVRAWVVVDRKRAREQARKLDGDLAGGRRPGPLHGIPVGIKDIVDVAGLPTAAGFAPWAGRVATRDAEVVARLRAAGAVILGKTVTTPFAWIDPPATRNPWDLARTPGGSSSGSAAAVAAGMCLGAIGSQTGGSITRPAAFCGVAGLKPTYGAVDARGIVPLAPSLDHPGPIARSVRDLALLLDAIADRSILRDHQPDVRKKPPRIGDLAGPFLDRADPVALAAHRLAIGRLADAGTSIHPVPLASDFEDRLRDHRTVMAAEAAAFHAGRTEAERAELPPRIRALVEEGLAVPAPAYIAALESMGAVRQVPAVYVEPGGLPIVDVMALPAALGPAPGPETTGDPAFNSPWSFAGVPAASFPVGLSAEGLPLAIQLVGRPGGDADLLAVAAWCEDAIRRAGMADLRDPSDR